MTRIPCFFLMILAVLVGAASPVAARASAAEPSAPLRVAALDDAELRRVLSAFELMDPNAGRQGAAATEALKALQKRHGLPQTGVVDAPTLEVLGGAPDALMSLPRVLYTVKRGDTLSGLAARFSTSLMVLVRLNPQITSIHRLSEAQALQVPLDVPAPSGIQAERVQVCHAMFAGTYRSASTPSDAQRVIDSYRDQLIARGFEIRQGKTLSEGITFRKGGEVAGRFTFSGSVEGHTEFALAVLTDPPTEAAWPAPPSAC